MHITSTLKTYIYVFFISSILPATSCRTKISLTLYLPFCKIYDFTIKNEPYKLSLMRDTSGGFLTYAGTVYSATTSGFIYINPDEADSSRPELLKFEFYSGVQKGFSFSGTVSPDGLTVDGYIKMQQNTPADSIRCTMQEGATQPFALNGITKRFPIKGGDSDMQNEFSVKLFWPQAGIPAITAMRYKKDVEELLKIDGNIYNYSANECLKKYEATFIETNTSDYEPDATPVYTREENWISLMYANEKWMAFEFHKLWYSSMMAHDQWYNKYTMYDMRTGRHLRLSDFFTVEGLKKIYALLQKYFKINYDLKLGEPLTKAGLYENFIQPNNNFCVTGEALHFHYGNYEIGPFSSGEFDITIPLSEFGNSFRYQPN